MTTTPYEPVLRFDAAGRAWTMERPADLATLWENLNSQHTAQPHFEDERLPYWTEIWPAALGLAEWLIRKKAVIEAMPCLDLGCGLGLSTLAGTLAGAHVLGMDYDPQALYYARRNAQANALTPCAWVLMDWRKPALRAGSIRYIWGADIMYERRFIEPVLHFLGHALAPSGTIWLADPCRNIWDSFGKAAEKSGFSLNCISTCEVMPLHPRPVPVTVRIWEMRRA